MKKLDTIFKSIIVFSILLAAISISYYFIVFLPNKEVVRKEEIRQDKIDACIEELGKSHAELVVKFAYSDIDAELKRETIDSLNSEYEQRKADCYKIK